MQSWLTTNDGIFPSNEVLILVAFLAIVLIFIFAPSFIPSSPAIVDAHQKAEKIKAHQKAHNSDIKAHQRVKHFAILICGPDPHARHEKNERGQHYIDLLQGKHDMHVWSQYVVYKDQFPTQSEIESFDALVLSGSKFDAHDPNAEWMKKLREIIRQVHKKQPETKLLGICFGHQIIANSLDFGESGPNPKRPKIFDFGVRDIRLHDTFFEVFSESLIPEHFQALFGQKTIRIAKSHGDVVLKLPENAVVLASSEVTDVEMYVIGNRVLGLQGHPEWTDKYFAGLMAKRFTGSAIPAPYAVWKYVLQTWLYNM